MKRLHAAALTLSLAAGLAVAIALTSPTVAQAWDINNLPPGFIAVHTSASGVVTCPEYWTVGYIPNTTNNSGHLCTDSPTFQQDLDAFVDANYTAPVTTTAEPTVTAATTTAAPPPADPVGTTTTVTVTAPDVSIESRVAALEANYAALAKRVDAIAQANTASWSAFIDATNAGASAVDAAIAARSAGQNAIYQLG